MSNVIQVAIGISLGIIAFVLALPAILPSYESDRTRRDRQKEHTNPHLSTPGENCSICAEEMDNDNMTYLPCSHAVHGRCLPNLRRGSKLCPICRAAV